MKSVILEKYDLTISVRHFLNESLKPDEKGRYRVYLRVTFRCKSTKMRSLIITNRYKKFEDIPKHLIEREVNEIINWVHHFHPELIEIKEVIKAYREIYSPAYINRLDQLKELYKTLRIRVKKIPNDELEFWNIFLKSAKEIIDKSQTIP